MIALGTVCNPAMAVRVCKAGQFSLRISRKVLRMWLLKGNHVPQKGSSQALKAAVLCQLSSLLKVGLICQIQIQVGLYLSRLID